MKTIRSLLLMLIVSVSCTKPDFDIHSCLGDRYTYEELRFFYETGFFHYKSTKKWIDDITISFEEGATQGDVQMLDAIIVELQPLVHPIKIRQVQKDGKIGIRIAYKHKGVDIGMQKNGVIELTTGFQNQMKSAKIWLAKGREGVDRKKTLRHELMHALGFEHPENRYGTVIGGARRYGSIDEYEARETLHDKFTDLDKAVIRILYEERMPRNLSREEFKRQLDELIRGDSSKVISK